MCDFDATFLEGQTTKIEKIRFLPIKKERKKMDGFWRNVPPYSKKWHLKAKKVRFFRFLGQNVP